MKTLLLFLGILPSTLFGAEPTGTTIPFIVNEVEFVSLPDSILSAMRQGNGQKVGAFVKTAKKIDVAPSELSKVIAETKKSVCEALQQKGSFKMWVKGEASGKIFGIGASGESGIEVSVDCKS